MSFACDNDHCRAVGCVCESREVEALIAAAELAAVLIDEQLTVGPGSRTDDNDALSALRDALAPFEEVNA